MDSELVVGGLKAAGFILLAVQALKVYGFVSGETAPKAAMFTALGLGVVSAVEQLFPETAPYIATFLQVFAGALAAGLGYEYLVRPGLERVGISVSSADLSDEG